MLNVNNQNTRTIFVKSIQRHQNDFNEQVKQGTLLFVLSKRIFMHSQNLFWFYYTLRRFLIQCGYIFYQQNTEVVDPKYSVIDVL